jgi:hypothetical protein
LSRQTWHARQGWGPAEEVEGRGGSSAGWSVRVPVLVLELPVLQLERPELGGSSSTGRESSRESSSRQ